MPQDSFFKKATLLICSSLDISVALWRVFPCLHERLPLHTITLNIYEPQLSGLRYIALADAQGGHGMDMILPLPPAIIESIESGQRLRDYLIINHPHDDPLGRIITPRLGLDGQSFIALRLVIEGQRLGVIDFFAPPGQQFTDQDARLLSQLREPFAIAMANALKHQELLDLKEKLLSDNRYLSSELLSQSGHEVIGAEGGLRGVMERVEQIAPLKSTVLLLGETGTGKEVIANAIHRLSPRRQQPFIKVNCGAIPENLIDSELFGHEKGAFTGAVKQSRGRFERADKGTIFLDEIGELPPWAQVRLLRVLQTQEIERVGGSPPIRLDIRVIAATHRNITAMVADGRFREDLWFRINMYPISIPPLRERLADIGPLTAHFVSKKAKMLGLQPPPRLSPQVIDELQRHHWPGNVRELENSIERALIEHRQGEFILPSWPERRSSQNPAAALPPVKELLPLDAAMRQHIEMALRLCGGKIHGRQGAAALLGLHPNTLRGRMHKLGMPFARAGQQSASSDPS